jgi:hypothetical protein
MASDEIDRHEVDRLVRELRERRPQPATPPKPRAEGKPAANQPVEAQADRESADVSVPKRGSRWTTARILMPAPSTAGRRTFSRSIALPKLPTFTMPALTEEARHTLIVRGWVALSVVLSVSMLYWPYPKTYLVGLLLYHFAVSVVLLTGVWSAKLTWDARLGAEHTLALGVVLSAIVFAAAEALPTVGYQMS